MNERKITSTLLDVYKDYLIRDEKSEATISKYLHDVRVFAEFAQDRPIDKNLVLEYKDMLGEAYSVSSANSMLAALNSFFRFMNWREAEVKRFKVQKQVSCKGKTKVIFIVSSLRKKLLKYAKKKGFRKVLFS